MLAVIVLIVSSGSAYAGATAAKLSDAEYFCCNAGPSDFTHCWLEKRIGEAVIPVKVFSPDGSEFLGTELLLRDDIYAGQPCPQDGLDTWDFLGDAFPYFACHHFNTGHH